MIHSVQCNSGNEGFTWFVLLIEPRLHRVRQGIGIFKYDTRRIYRYTCHFNFLILIFSKITKGSEQFRRSINRNCDKLRRVVEEPLSRIKGECGTLWAPQHRNFEREYYCLTRRRARERPVHGLVAWLLAVREGTEQNRASTRLHSNGSHLLPSVVLQPACPMKNRLTN